ncbi:hypothetical protein LMC31_19395, partial [Escherichia coli]|uniref:hypothetical protein n=1 Tax=Escherichia coli TaxID=562 RepID=UPI001E651C1E
ALVAVKPGAVALLILIKNKWHGKLTSIRECNIRIGIAFMLRHIKMKQVYISLLCSVNYF